MTADLWWQDTFDKGHTTEMCHAPGEFVTDTANFIVQCDWVVLLTSPWRFSSFHLTSLLIFWAANLDNL